MNLKEKGYRRIIKAVFKYWRSDSIIMWQKIVILYVNLAWVSLIAPPQGHIWCAQILFIWPFSLLQLQGWFPPFGIIPVGVCVSSGCSLSTNHLSSHICLLLSPPLPMRHLPMLLIQTLSLPRVWSLHSPQLQNHPNAKIYGLFRLDWTCFFVGLNEEAVPSPSKAQDLGQNQRPDALPPQLR